MAYNKPVKVGDTVELEIVNLGQKGDGVGKVGESGFIVITPETKLGEIYEIRIDRVFDNYARGEVIKWVSK